MSFLAPAAFALAALAGPLIALYMLRSRRSRLTVPSVMLWEEAGVSVSSAVPWQRLRVTPLLVLQLVVLALLVAALARPFLSEQTLLGPHTVMVIDTSGSMAMADRWELLQESASSLAEDASESNLVSIVEAGPDPRVLVAFSSDPEAIQATIEAMRPGGGIERLDDAVRLARGLDTPDRPTTLLILSDGGPEGPALETEPLDGAEHLLFNDVGPNVGIAAFSTEPSAEGATRVFLELANWSDAPASRSVELAVNGVPLAFVAVDLDPLGRARETVPLDAGPGDVLTARIVDAADSLALDDVATITVSVPQANTVSVVGEGSAFLSALISASSFEAAVGERSDLLVVDGGPLPDIDRPVWLIRPDEPPDGIELVGTVQNVGVTFQQPGEPILDQVDLSEVVVAEAQLVDSLEWFPLVRAGDVPLVLLGDVNGQRAVYFTFDITHSNLPLQVAFPVLGSRIFEHLAGGGAVAVTPELAGTPLVLTGPEGTQPSLTRPDGTTESFPVGTSVIRSTSQVGLYRVDYVAEEGNVVATEQALRRFAPSESAGDFRQIETIAPAGSDGGSGELIREWFGWLLASALVFLLLEWWLGHRRPIRSRTTTVGAA